VGNSTLESAAKGRQWRVVASRRRRRRRRRRIEVMTAEGIANESVAETARISTRRQRFIAMEVSTTIFRAPAMSPIAWRITAVRGIIAVR
jgi:hypothetical protein